VVLVTYIELAH